MSVDDTPAPQVQDPVVTDTSQPTEVSETSTQTNEAPEATPAQEEKQPEIKAEDTAEGKLYAGKYKTVEDMERAYQELNSKFTNTSQEKAELSRILNDAFMTPEPQPQVAPQEEFYQEESNVNPEIEELKRKSAVQSFIIAHPDAEPETMQQILSDDPLIKQIQGHEAKLEYAYLRSQNMSKAKAIAEARETATQTTQAKVIEKQSAQVESARPQAQSVGEEELTQSQLRDTLRSDDAFNKLIDKKFPGISKMKTR